MGNGEAEHDEPETKKRFLNTVSSSPMARNSNGPISPDGKAVDAAALQYQNQKLVQMLDAQKSETHALEKKFREVKDKQDFYDETLMTVNRLWNQLVDDFILLRTLIGGNPCDLETYDEPDICTGTTMSCPPEATFLCRLLQINHIEKGDGNGIIKYVQEALDRRHSSTMDLLKHLQETIDAQQTKLDGLEAEICRTTSREDVIIQLQKLDSQLKVEANNLRIVIRFLHMKHKKYAEEVQAYVVSHARDQSDLRHISGELEEAMAELEETRRKLVSLKMQKDGLSKVHSSPLVAVNGSSSPDKVPEKILGLKELKDSVEEAKTLATTRLAELQEAQEDNSVLLKQLEALEDELKDNKYVLSSRPYLLLNDKLQHLNSEIDRYRGLVDSFQADRNHMTRREKELSSKAEAADSSRSTINLSNAKIEQLEQQLQKCIVERNDTETKLEEALQDSGRKDFKDEIRVMASALSREMELMETQLNRCVEAAREAVSLRKEISSLEARLKMKSVEHRNLSDKCAKQMQEIKTLKTMIEMLETEKQQLRLILDMYAQECFGNRTIMEIKESESRAHIQAEILRQVLEDHSLELRVKAAKEAEIACLQRLAAAESEKADLWEKVDATERELFELREAITVKDAEAEAYISEIETIGQAYEDMQTQNQHLQQQVTERDDYNIKLVSESVKMRQIRSSLLSEKQSAMKQLQQVNSSVDLMTARIARAEDQMKTLIAQAEKASAENRHVVLTIEKEKLELMEAEKILKYLKSALESSQEELQQNQQIATKLRADLEEQRGRGKKLKEEHGRVTSLLEKLSPENEAAAIQKLQDEINECKAILKCGVCFDRPKQVVITKCFHLFCSNCIQRNLEIRHRKCPACGTPFGQSDVREVNI